MIHIENNAIKDDSGRTLLLRGVNLSGSSKVPFTPDGATYRSEGFFDHRRVSFVGRPFPLAEAGEHFRRLRTWGLTFIRFLITWEAIEHAGPGLYDEEYLDYLRDVVKKAGEYGISLFIDPHQDMWSRFTGGDGAPGWTLEAAGFDMTHFAETGAAIVHATHGDPFPQMIWPSNSGKLATATLFSLFFGGSDFAPRLKVEGQSIQDYLQDHYIHAVLKVVERLKGLPNVAGYDTLNEPLTGYIGWKDLSSNGGELNLGCSPTPLQAMALGDGYPQTVDFWKLGRFSIQKDGQRTLNAGRQRAWLEDRTCIWRDHGVWDIDRNGSPIALKPDYFSCVDGRNIDFTADYFMPFADRVIRGIRQVDPGAVIFLEGAQDARPPQWSGAQPANLVYAPHWYDGFVLVMKRFLPFIGVHYHTHSLVLGAGAIRKSFVEQLGDFPRQAADHLHGIPTLMGEFGTPMDLNKKKSFANGDFRPQTEALDRSYQAIEANLLHGTQWNYTPDNSNARGDLWNDEDFSIFSRDQQKEPSDINSGGRALKAAVRPYPRATAGTLLSLSFDMHRRAFTFEFKHDPEVTAPTEIFVPNLQYPNGYRVQVSDGSYEIDRDTQTLIYRHSLQVSRHKIVILPK